MTSETSKTAQPPPHRLAARELISNHIEAAWIAGYRPRAIALCEYDCAISKTMAKFARTPEETEFYEANIAGREAQIAYYKSAYAATPDATMASRKRKGKRNDK